ncbi:diacylglycerol/lipid kinase family protein [Deminuibacter soli]|uniref:Diacylglycerol kinase n=1 Tax=Deminuibacter soli TaxID=2291815 RepID=A0A3E1NRA1_9BACT|nr:YegS/Rv2252/BmrU family lipid kinase [Deminuibacter soli]RFM30466.1 diacylglycerol kinase [Deminuibacter soli]
MTYGTAISSKAEIVGTQRDKKKPVTGRNIVYLVNPISGTSKKDSLLKVIESISRQQKLQYEIIPTNASGNYDFLKEKIYSDHITDVIIIGGDGTVNQVIEALHSQPVNFGIIPFGSGNGLALAAGIPRKPRQAFELVLEGKASAVDAFKINGRFSCMLSGLGFDAQVAHDFAAKASRGLLTYTQQSLMNYFKAQPYQFEILLDDFSFFTDAFFISIANGNQFGNNVTIAPQASLQDGLLDVVIVQKMNKARLPFAILRQIRGNNQLQQLVDDMSQKNILYFQTPGLTIRNPKLAPLHVDGEPRDTAAELKIEVLPNCFRLIRPQA